MNSHSPQALPGRRAARKEDRRQAILDAAEASFYAHGFAGTSMSSIAAQIGGSKTTLWAYFPSKEHLFQAWLDRRVESFAVALDEALLSGGGIEGTLTRFGRVVLEKMLAEPSCRLRRLIGAEAERFPAVAEAFYDRGPRRMFERLCRYLADQMAAGALRPGDPMVAARQFTALCQAGAFADRIWHRLNGPVEDVVTDVAAAVDSFLRAWTPSPAPAEACTAPA